MPKYTLLSRVYLSDGELYELLSPKNLGRRDLLRIARRRGMIFGEKSQESDVRSALTLMPSDWKLVSSTLELIASPDREERKTSLHVTNCEEKLNVSDMISKTQGERAEKHSERYNPIRVDDKTLKIEVTYVDVDSSLAVVYQRQEKKLTVEVTQNGDKVSIIHTANERAMRIVNDLKSRLTFKPNIQPEVIRISLQGVRDPAIRTKFFTKLIKSVAGYNFLNATHLNVDRRMPVEEENEDNPESKVVDAEKKKAGDKIKGLVNQVALKGQQVLADQLYQTVESSGYYISNISWSCQSIKDSRYGIDCVAGFKDPVLADEFTFDVVRSWEYKAEAPDEEETLKVSESDKRELNRILEAAAFTAFDAIVKTNTKPNSSSRTNV